jgi:Domain of unknown function (DUF4147)
MISDVPGDDLSVIASGPTVPDVSTRSDALAVLTKYRIEIPAAVAMHLNDRASETPKPGDPRFSNVTSRLVATPQKSLEAAASVARDAGIPSVILGNAIEGEARDVGIVHAGIARQCGDWGQPLEIPCVLISGGETTVTVRGNGRGGPQYGVSSRSRDRCRWQKRYLGARRRYGWHRRRRRQRGSDPYTRHVAPSEAHRHRRQDAARGQRRLQCIRVAERSCRDRSHAYQRQRFQSHTGYKRELILRRSRNAKIIATLGPSSSSPVMISSAGAHGSAHQPSK